MVAGTAAAVSQNPAYRPARPPYPWPARMPGPHWVRSST